MPLAAFGWSPKAHHRPAPPAQPPMRIPCRAVGQGAWAGDAKSPAQGLFCQRRAPYPIFTTQPCGSGASPRWIATSRSFSFAASWPGPPLPMVKELSPSVT